MCFGNDSAPQSAQLPSPPPPPEFMDVIDEVTGVQSIVTTDGNGKKRRVTSRLPRTPEEDARYKVGEELIAKSIQNIKQLYKYDPNSVVDFAPIINTFADINNERMEALGQIANIGNIAQDIEEFKEMQSSLIDKEFSRIRRERIEDLTHAGLSGSSAAREYLAALDNEEVLTRQKGNIAASQYGEDLASKRLNRNAEAFGLQEMGRQGRLDAAKTDYALKRDQIDDLERRRQLAIEENKGNLAIGSGIVGQDLSKALASNAPQLSTQTFALEAGDSLSRYNANVNRTMVNHKMALDDYNNRPPSFGDIALQAGGAIGAAYLTGNPAGFAGFAGASQVGKKIF